MTKIKICGLKRREDILYVNQLKPDYAGFIFAKSPRQIERDWANELIKGLNKGIKKVGVFLNHPIGEVHEIAKACDLDIIQLHGDEDPMYCKDIEYPLWKALRIKDENSLKNLEDYDVDGFLLDTFVKDSYGGTGQVFNWHHVSHISKDHFVVLAGGLTIDNIKDAIEMVKPMVVDISSGVESNGVKDFEKMRKIIEKVRGII